VSCHPPRCFGIVPATIPALITFSNARWYAVTSLSRMAVLLAAGADPDAGDDEGDTPLSVALAHGSSATATLLVHRGPP